MSGKGSLAGGHRLRVAFFQRFFAHYQSGLVAELAGGGEHDYVFFGDDRDPLDSGIEPIPEPLRSRIAFRKCTTTHWGEKLAFQSSAIEAAISGDFDVFIFEGSWTIATNWLAIPIARARGKRVLSYTHGWLERESGFKGWLRDWFYRLSHALLVYGPRAKAIGVERGFSPNDIYVVYNSLDTLAANPRDEGAERISRENFRRQWLGEGDRPLIVSVGRLTPVKRYPLLLTAAKRLADGGTPIDVMLVGDGPERSSLEGMARELGIRLILTGSKYDEAFLAGCFAAADATVIPGAAGLTVIHSLAYGTPVLVHDEPDEQMPESEAVTDGVNGAVFRNGDADDLARAIERVLRALPKTPQVARQCREVVDRAYNPRSMRAVFDDAVAGRPASP